MCFFSYVSVFLLSTQEVITWLTQLGVGPTWQQKCWERLSPLKYLTTRYTDTHTHPPFPPCYSHRRTHLHIPTWGQMCPFIVPSHAHTCMETQTHPLVSSVCWVTHLIKDGCPISIKGFVYRWAGQVAVLTIPLCLLRWTQTTLIFYASSGWTLLEEL